jgi:hypothetical protein
MVGDFAMSFAQLQPPRRGKPAGEKAALEEYTSPGPLLAFTTLVVISIALAFCWYGDDGALPPKADKKNPPPTIKGVAQRRMERRREATVSQAAIVTKPIARAAKVPQAAVISKPAAKAREARCKQPVFQKPAGLVRKAVYTHRDGRNEVGVWGGTCWCALPYTNDGVITHAIIQPEQRCSLFLFVVWRVSFVVGGRGERHLRRGQRRQRVRDLHPQLGARAGRAAGPLGV